MINWVQVNPGGFFIDEEILIEKEARVAAFMATLPVWEVDVGEIEISPTDISL